MLAAHRVKREWPCRSEKAVRRPSEIAARIAEAAERALAEADARRAAEAATACRRNAAARRVRSQPVTAIGKRKASISDF